MTQDKDIMEWWHRIWNIRDDGRTRRLWSDEDKEIKEQLGQGALWNDEDRNINTDEVMDDQRQKEQSQDDEKDSSQGSEKDCYRG